MITRALFIRRMAAGAMAGMLGLDLLSRREWLEPEPERLLWGDEATDVADEVLYGITFSGSAQDNFITVEYAVVGGVAYVLPSKSEKPPETHRGYSLT